MAVFDRDNAKVVVRVVYDGPGNAGKTTNLFEMCHFFTSRRRSELFSPESRDGRTMWFDWLQVDGGLVAGHSLRCQIVTVPGQVVLRRRRSALLRAADVVVLVCDSTPSGLELVRPAFGRIRQFIDEQVGAEIPIVVQANKQDLPGALPPEDIAAALGADAAIPIVGARANAGIGVKETLVLAIRAAANRAQQLVLERGIDALAGSPDDADTVLAELRRLEDTEDHTLDELLARPGFVEDPHVTEPPDAAPIEQIAPFVEAEPPEAGEARGHRTRPTWWPTPPLGDASVAPGNLWPAATGREVLRGLASSQPRARLDLIAQPGDRDGSGKATTVIYDANGWCLKTSMSRRFDDLDAARVALVKLARTKMALGALTLQGTVLVTCEEPETGYWIWTFAPWRTTVRAALSDAVAGRHRSRIGAALVDFAGAVTEALVRAVRVGQGLDLHPSNFARDGEVLVYLDDEVTAAPPLLGAAHAILQRAEELAEHPAEIDRYAASLLEQIAARLTDDDLARLELVDDLRMTTARAPLARALRARLLVALDRSRGATAAAVDAAWDASEPAPLPEPPVVAALEPAAVEAVAPPVAAVEPLSAAIGSAPHAPLVETWPLPPTAAAHLPSGFIWPVVAGRELVRQILSRTPTRRDGRPFTYDLGDYTLSTSSERRFSEVDDARAELLRLARAQVARGAAQSRVVLVLAPDDARGGHWIWTIAPAAGESAHLGEVR